MVRDHPESPERIERILNLLKERGLYDQCARVTSRYSTDEELNLCHPQGYIDNLRSLEKKTLPELEEMSRNMNSVYYNKKTFECATLSTGCLLSVVDAVCTKKFTNGVAVIRPPGHHANSGCCSGFCFFNSVAVASRYAQKNYKSIKKILILDFDVHHGNGTQDLYDYLKKSLFISFLFTFEYPLVLKKTIVSYLFHYIGTKMAVSILRTRQVIILTWDENKEKV